VREEESASPLAPLPAPTDRAQPTRRTAHLKRASDVCDGQGHDLHSSTRSGQDMATVGRRPDRMGLAGHGCRRTPQDERHQRHGQKNRLFPAEPRLGGHRCVNPGTALTSAGEAVAAPPSARTIRLCECVCVCVCVCVRVCVCVSDVSCVEAYVSERAKGCKPGGASLFVPSLSPRAPTAARPRPTHRRPAMRQVEARQARAGRQEEVAIANAMVFSVREKKSLVVARGKNKSRSVAGGGVLSGATQKCCKKSGGRPCVPPPCARHAARPSPGAGARPGRQPASRLRTLARPSRPGRRISHRPRHRPRTMPSPKRTAACTTHCTATAAPWPRTEAVWRARTRCMKSSR